MAFRQKHEYRATHIDQLKALESPVRLEIVAAVEAGRRCSIAQVARELGRTPESLYYHFARLQKVGLLVEVGRRRSVRHTETVYATPGRSIVLPYPPADHRQLEAVVRITTAFLRLAPRDVERGLRKGDTRVRGPSRNLHASRTVCWLSPAELKEVNQLIDRIERLTSRAVRRKDARLSVICMALAPAEIRKSPRTKEN